MQYLLQDLIKLPLKERLFIIENVITNIISNENDINSVKQFFEHNLSGYLGEVKLKIEERKDNQISIGK